MAPIALHSSGTSTKLLLIGDSGAGKTGALMSLAAAGYRLRILDFDSGADILRNYATGAESPYIKQCPTVAANIDVITCTDMMKAIGGALQPVRATAWQKAIEMMMHWKETAVIEGKPTITNDLGKLVEWGEKDILVIDSLTMAASAARNYHLQLNGKLGQARTQNEYRRDVGATQSIIRTLLETLYSDGIKCNIIVNSHITLVTESGLGPQSEEARGESSRGYPSSVGRALSPLIPRYFNSCLTIDTEGSGPSAKHYIYTKFRGNVLLKTPAPLKVKDKYEISNGLAEYFAAVRSI